MKDRNGKGGIRLVKISNSKMLKRVKTFGDIDRSEVISKMRKEQYYAEKQAYESTREFALDKSEREVLQKVAKIDDQIKALQEYQKTTLKDGIYNCIKERLEYIVETNGKTFNNINDADVIECLKANSTSIKKLADLCAGDKNERKFTELENLFINLINLNIKFVYYSPAKAVSSSDVKFTKDIVAQEGERLFKFLTEKGLFDNPKFAKRHESAFANFSVDKKNTSL